MYRLLIVDNEEIIVEGLVELFSEKPEMELEVIGAYSADEAIVLLEKTKIDIVLTDIHMPGMNGLELQQLLIRQWPWCKVIFLTGYNRFDYAQQAMRNEGVDFVLKTEGDRSIIEAVNRAKAKLMEETEAKRTLEEARRRLDKALPLLRQTFLKELLDGENEPSDGTLDMLQELGTGLTGCKSVLPVVGRMDDLPSSSKEHALFVCALRDMIEGYMSAMTAIRFVEYDKSRFVLLMQMPDPPRDGRIESEHGQAERTQRFVHGMLERIQHESKHAWKVRLSFALADAFVPWERLSDTVYSLKHYFHNGLGVGPESLLDGRYVPEDRAGLSAPPGRTGAGPGGYERLRRLLEQGRREEFEELFGQMIAEPETVRARSGNDPRRLELHCHLAAMLVAAVNQWDLHEAVQGLPDFRELAVMDDAKTWDERFDRALGLARTLFELREDGYRKDSDELVSRVNRYIERNLHGDLSLTRLGEAMQLNPSYLSRQYKQTTGIGVSEYIMEVRLEAAKRLLTESALKIHEISAEVGFLTDATFYRCFKKAVRLTPQEYREVNK